MSGSLVLQQMESLARQRRVQYSSGVEVQQFRFAKEPGVVFSDSTSFGTATVDLAQWVPAEAIAALVSVRAQRTGTFGPLEIYASADWVDKWMRIGMIEDGETVCFSTPFVPVFGRKIQIKVDDACDNVFEVSIIGYVAQAHLGSINSACLKNFQHIDISCHVMNFRKKVLGIRRVAVV